MFAPQRQPSFRGIGFGAWGSCPQNGCSVVAFSECATPAVSPKKAKPRIAAGNVLLADGAAAWRHASRRAPGGAIELPSLGAEEPIFPQGNPKGMYHFASVPDFPNKFSQFLL